MTRKEYLAKLKTVSIDNEIVSSVTAVYGHMFPEIVQQMLSFSKESIFFENEFRTLSLSEILDASDDLHVDFKSLGIIPLVDCGENDFIVYCFDNDSWSKFNIVDETFFKRRSQFVDLFE